MTKLNTNFDFENSVVFLIILNQFLIFVQVFAQNQDYFSNQYDFRYKISLNIQLISPKITAGFDSCSL